MLNSTPKISVVIPHYNHGQFLREAVASCLNQSLAPQEIIIVDDASTDGSLAVAQELEKKHQLVRLIQRKENLGAIAGHNTGLNHSSGDYIVYRAADDLTLPGFFEKAAYLLEKHPQAGLCCGDVTYFTDRIEDGQVETLALSPKEYYFSPKRLEAELTSEHLIHGATVMVRTKLLKAIGGFALEHAWYTDWVSFMTIALRHGLCYAPQAFAAFRLAAESYSTSGSTRQIDQSNALLSIALHFQKRTPDLLPILKETGMLAFFGQAMRKTLAAHSGLFDPSLIESAATASLRLPNPQTGVRGVINRRLEELKPNIDSLLRSNKLPIFFYGAGTHTDRLIESWRNLEFPPPNAIVVSSKPTEIEYCGYPLKALSEIEPNTACLVIISSKSYEGTMEQACKDHLPQADIITFWRKNRFESQC